MRALRYSLGLAVMLGVTGTLLVAAQPTKSVSPPEVIAKLSGNVAHGGDYYLKNCMSCHGRGGQAFIVNYPRLSAQWPSYTIQQLSAFRADKRKNNVMNPVAYELSDQNIADLAVYLASSGVARPWKSDDAALRATGHSLYTQGKPSAGLAACSSCHGADGKGNAAANFPLIAGQSPKYFTDRIGDLAKGNTDGSANAKIMTKIAQAMTPADTKALDEYIKTLPSGMMK